MLQLWRDHLVREGDPVAWVSEADALFRVCRTERMIRVGPDGPDGSRPSDVDDSEPTEPHPTMDADGTIHFDE